MTFVGSGPASPGMIARAKAKAPVRRQQAPVTVVTSTRLAHGPVVDSGYGPAAARDRNANSGGGAAGYFRSKLY